MDFIVLSFGEVGFMGDVGGFMGDVGGFTGDVGGCSITDDMPTDDFANVLGGPMV